MGELRKEILRLAKQQPVTRGWLAHELKRDRATIHKALHSLVRRGWLKTKPIRVQWLGGHVTEAILFYTEESASMLPQTSQGDVLNPEDPACPPCISEAYHRMLLTETLFNNMKRQT